MDITNCRGMLMWLTNVRFKIDAMLNAVRICTNCKIYPMMHSKWSFVRTGHSNFRKKTSQCTKYAVINYEIPTSRIPRCNERNPQFQLKVHMIPLPDNLPNWSGSLQCAIRHSGAPQELMSWTLCSHLLNHNSSKKNQMNQRSESTFRMWPYQM